MTAVVPAGSAAMAAYDPEADRDLGLEDFDEEDLVMPRFSIDHENACFKDNASGEQTQTLECIVLGLVKQRVLWDVEPGASTPLCKSYDNHQGYANPKSFPWRATK